MKTYNLKVNGNPYEVKIISVSGGKAEVDVNGAKFSVDIEGAGAQAAPAKPAAQPAQAKAAAPSGGGSGTVTAPMPGAVVKILAKEGDSVKAGDPLLVIEAMKMENEISANATGKITKIHVKAGENVAQGATLVTIG
ncbi:MAG: biotin/lipoyl-binding protein [Spirochaetes bacterium]|jgi:biotin carboxyl carrier protein|nr:biotin/lipoyl-binding protein [Spirochaetota bacterium]